MALEIAETASCEAPPNTWKDSRRGHSTGTLSRDSHGGQSLAAKIDATVAENAT
jgi:hypothetical protein